MLFSAILIITKGYRGKGERGEGGSYSYWIFPGININFPMIMHPLGGWVFEMDVTSK